MTGAIPALSHRLRPLVGRDLPWRRPAFLMSAPAFARGPDGIADVAEKVIDAVVNISTSQTVEAKSGRWRGEGSGAMPQLPPGSPFEEFFDDFFKNRRGGEGRRPAAAQDQLARLRLHRRYVGHRRDQQSRHRRCRRDQRHHERRHQVQGRTGRRRQEDRSCGAKVQADQAADRGEVRRFRQAAARRMGDRDRQSVQPRRHGDGGHRLGAQPRHQFGSL